jgi:hypothetical protein
MAAGPISERNQDATIYVGGLDEKVRTKYAESGSFRIESLCLLCLL